MNKANWHPRCSDKPRFACNLLSGLFAPKGRSHGNNSRCGADLHLGCSWKAEDVFLESSSPNSLCVCVTHAYTGVVPSSIL